MRKCLGHWWNSLAKVGCFVPEYWLRTFLSWETFWYSEDSGGGMRFDSSCFGARLTLKNHLEIFRTSLPSSQVSFCPVLIEGIFHQPSFESADFIGQPPYWLSFPAFRNGNEENESSTNITDGIWIALRPCHPMKFFKVHFYYLWNT